MSLEAIAALLGHRSMRMTMVYARIADRTVADEYFAVSEQVEALYDTAPKALPGDAEGAEMHKLRAEMHRRMLGKVTGAESLVRPGPADPGSWSGSAGGVGVPPPPGMPAAARSGASCPCPRPGPPRGGPAPGCPIATAHAPRSTRWRPRCTAARSISHGGRAAAPGPRHDVGVLSGGNVVR